MSTLSKSARRRQSKKKKGTNSVQNFQIPQSLQSAARRQQVRQKINGDFLADLRSLARPAGAGLGGLLAGPGGAAAGGIAAEALMRWVTGRGDYNIVGNSLIEKVDTGQQVPAFRNGFHACTISHREFIGDIIEPGGNNGAFLNRTFNINPAISTTFPFLSALAQNFEQYRIRGMLFQYVPTSSFVNNAAGAGVGMGVVVTATDYDSADLPFASKLQMENSQYCNSAMPNQYITHMIECKRNLSSLEVLYTRTTLPALGDDLRFYDFGLFQLATQGVPSNANPQTLGELWVTYEIDLIKPQLVNLLSNANVIMWKFRLNLATTSAAAPFGDPGTAILTSGSAPSPPELNGLVITFSPSTIGRYFLYYNFITNAANPVATAITWTTGASVTLLNVFQSSGASVISTQPSTTNVVQSVACFQLNGGVGSTLTIGNTSFPGGVKLGADLLIQLVSPTIT